MAQFTIDEGVYIPRELSSYPEDPFRRLVEIKDEGHNNFVFDETYPYVDHSLKARLNYCLGFLFKWGIAAPFNRIKWGFRVEGNVDPYRNYLKDGAVVVCNHVYKMDALCVNSALRRFRRIWIPMYSRHFNGSQSWLLVNMGGIPVPDTAAGMRKFNEAFDEYHARKDWILVFPEAVRWDFYAPVRPFRKGAFTMAWKYEVPVIPTALVFRPRRGIYKLFGSKDEPLVTLRIGAPIFPDKDAARKDEVDRLMKEAHESIENLAGIHGVWPYKENEDTSR